MFFSWNLKFQLEKSDLIKMFITSQIYEFLVCEILFHELVIYEFMKFNFIKFEIPIREIWAGENVHYFMNLCSLGLRKTFHELLVYEFMKSQIGIGEIIVHEKIH